MNNQPCKLYMIDFAESIPNSAPVPSCKPKLFVLNDKLVLTPEKNVCVINETFKNQQFIKSNVVYKESDLNEFNEPCLLSSPILNSTNLLVQQLEEAQSAVFDSQEALERIQDTNMLAQKNLNHLDYDLSDRRFGPLPAICSEVKTMFPRTQPKFKKNNKSSPLVEDLKFLAEHDTEHGKNDYKVELGCIADKRGKRRIRRMEDEKLTVLSACKFGDINLIKKALETCDINSADENGWTALHEAAMRDCQYTSILNFLLENGAKVDMQDNNKNTPLYWAVLFHCHENVKLLLSYGADINIKNENKVSPLCLATRISDADSKILLLGKPLPNSSAEKKVLHRRIRNNDSSLPVLLSSPSILKRKNADEDIDKIKNNKRKVSFKDLNYEIQE